MAAAPLLVEVGDHESPAVADETGELVVAVVCKAVPDSPSSTASRAERRKDLLTDSARRNPPAAVSVGGDHPIVPGQRHSSLL
ncbi:hypothetical protein ABZ864_10225 [Streptomyces sp. NPDC047082]|uniref:hypothetical protein n=1 Tax=Streptomyces sp. NPDC047082 TaxID=3155259 RepID=UPI0033EA85E1